MSKFNMIKITLRTILNHNIANAFDYDLMLSRAMRSKLSYMSDQTGTRIPREDGSSDEVYGLVPRRCFCGATKINQGVLDIVCCVLKMFDLENATTEQYISGSIFTKILLIGIIDMSEAIASDDVDRCGEKVDILMSELSKHHLIIGHEDDMERLRSLSVELMRLLCIYGGETIVIDEKELRISYRDVIHV